jgi:hypothetical protein
VETANHDRDPMDAKLSREINRAGELIRLYTDETDEASITVAPEPADNSLNRNRSGRFVVGCYCDRYAVAENAPLTRTLRETVEDGERIRRHETAPPLNYIAVVVIVGWLD